MPYIKPQIRNLVDKFIENLSQVVAGEGLDGNLNYAISRLAASSYAPDGKWRYSSIQRAAGLFHCIAHEFDRRVADVYEDEAIDRNGDIFEYKAADIEDDYRHLVRYVVSQFPVNGTMNRGVFDEMISQSVASWDSDEDMFAFTNRLHAEKFIVMHPITVTLGVDGLELRKCLEHRNAKHRS